MRGGFGSEAAILSRQNSREHENMFLLQLQLYVLTLIRVTLRRINT